MICGATWYQVVAATRSEKGVCKRYLKKYQVMGMEKDSALWENLWRVWLGEQIGKIKKPEK